MSMPVGVKNDTHNDISLEPNSYDNRKTSILRAGISPQSASTREGEEIKSGAKRKGIQKKDREECELSSSEVKKGDCALPVARSA